MSKVRVLPDHVANQIAAGEVVERPASVAKELVENSIDAGATRIDIDIEAGGRRLLKISDDGEGMVRDDAVLAFERHATSKIRGSDDLTAIATLGFRGEALASIASVAKVELTTRTEEAGAATRVTIEGGRMRDVQDAAHPRGTTIAVRDLFFNVPARRKFLRSEATETFHLTNLVTHYALAHPEIAFTFTNNGREVLRATSAQNLRERAYQIFGAEFLENLLEVNGGHPKVAGVSGYVSAPRDRRTTRDSQYLFVNRRFVRDRLIGRALSEGYRSILPHGVYPAALLFMETPLEEVDVNVHPAKTEVRFRRASAVADAVREAVRAALASAGYVREERDTSSNTSDQTRAASAAMSTLGTSEQRGPTEGSIVDQHGYTSAGSEHQQSRIDFASLIASVEEAVSEPEPQELSENGAVSVQDPVSESYDESQSFEVTMSVPNVTAEDHPPKTSPDGGQFGSAFGIDSTKPKNATLPPLNSDEKFARQVTPESFSNNIRPSAQLDESFTIATDDDRR